MKKTTNNRGFTLVEMMVVVALLSIVSVLLYQMWFYLYTSHQRTEMLYIQQNAANQVAEWIEANTSTATRVEITQRVDSTKDPAYMYIYSSTPDDYKTTKIEYWYYDTTTSRAVTGVLTDVPLELNFYTVALNKDRPSDDSKAMTFSVAAHRWEPSTGFSDTDYSYQTESLVSFPNMARAMQAQKSGTYTDSDGNPLGIDGKFDKSDSDVGGAAIKFKSGTSVSTPINITFDGTKCFIATAAYGSPNDITVATLRMFRDEILLKNPLGSAFVDFYYRVSPPIADAIAQSPAARFVVRTALTPLVLLATLMLQPMWIIVTSVTILYLYIVKFYVFPKKSLQRN